MRTTTLRAVALLVAAAASAAPAAEQAESEKKAALCFACHGPNGNAANPVVPSLAGQPKQFVTTQLIMFREGRRKAPQMSPVAAPLSNADINELGTYFAAQQPDYLRAQLRGFRARTRFDMDGAAQPLSGKDGGVLAGYLVALP